MECKMKNDGGKGSKPRPIVIPRKEYDKNWNRIFNKGKQNATSRRN